MSHFDAPPGYATFADVADETEEWIGDLRDGTIQRLRFGLRAEADRLGGILPGQQWVVGARPSVGKSAKVMQGWVRDFLNPDLNAPFADKVLVCIDNWEMSAVDVMARFLAAETGLTFDELTSNHQKLPKADVLRVMEAKTRIENWPILFCNAPLPPDEWEESKYALAARFPGRQLINILDHTRLGRRSYPRQNEEEMIAQYLFAGKRVAKATGMVSIVVSQVGRDYEKDGPRKDTGLTLPRLSDLWGASAVEQAADGVVLLHRPYLYGHKEWTTASGKTISCLGPDGRDRLLIASIPKLRHGRVGVMYTTHDLARYRFSDLEPAASTTSTTNC